MRYQRSYVFLFQNHHWPTDLLAGSCCLLIPLVGWALFIGYLVEILESLRERSDEDYPAFELDRVGDYLSRGLGPGLVQLAGWLPVCVFAIVTLAMAMPGGDPAKGPSAGLKVVVLGLPPVLFILVLLVSFLLLPLILYFSLRASSV